MKALTRHSKALIVITPKKENYMITELADFMT
jgi:hypothetical protein